HPVAIAKSDNPLGLYIPVKGSNQNVTTGGVRTYFNMEGNGNVGFDAGYVKKILNNPTANDEVTTYFEGTERVAGVIGASAATEKEYISVMLNAPSHGSVEGASIYGESYEKGVSGAVITIKATGDSPYYFRRWTIESTNPDNNITSAASPFTFAFTENITITAEFTEAKRISIQPDDYEMDYGQPVPTDSDWTYKMKIDDEVIENSEIKAAIDDKIYRISTTMPEDYPGTYDINVTVKDVNTYYENFTVGGVDYFLGDLLSGKFTINRLDALSEAPTAKVLTYNAQEQELINAGLLMEGNTQSEILYSIGDEYSPGLFSTNIPTATASGTYYVYYKLEETDIYKAVEPTKIEVTITPKNLIFSGITAKDKTYDGTDSIEFDYSNLQMTGIIENEDVTVVADGTFNDVNAGANKSASVNYYLEGENASNYTISSGSGELIATINKAPLTITADNKAVTYGDAAPAYSVTITGYVNNEDGSVLGGSISYTCTYAQFSSVGDYTITPSGYTAENYAITFTPGTLTVSAKAITISINVKESTYGDAQVTLTADESEILHGDTGVYTLSCEVAPTTAVGSYNIVGADTSDNYTITFTNGTNAYTVNQAALTITADNKAVTYGDAIPAYSVSFVGLKNNETNAVLGGSVAYACTYAQYSSVGDYTITPSGFTSSNYAITFTPGTLTVAAKEITIAIESKESTYGDAQVTLTADESAILNGDTGVYSLACEVAPTTNVGTYDIVGTDTSDDYIITFTNSTNAYTVNKAALTVTADNKAVTYGDAVPAYSVTITGYVNNETVLVLGGSVSYTCTYAQFSPVGDYTITPSGYTSLNYAITFTPGAVTVETKDIEVTIDNKTSVYGEALLSLTSTADENALVGEDKLSEVYSLSKEDGNTAGEYAINAVLLNTNYNLVAQAGKYTITKATPTYIVPTGIEVVANSKLSDIVLPTGFAWKAADTSVGSEAGEKVFKATFTPVDTANYVVVEDIDVTIAIVEKWAIDDTEIEDVEVVINGKEVDKNIALKVEVKSDVKSKEIKIDYPKAKSFLKSSESFAKVYNVKLIRTINGVEEEIQPSDIAEGTTIKVRMALPEDCETFRILHIHSADDIEEITEYTVIGQEVEFEISRLSEFAIVTKGGEGFCVGWIVFIFAMLELLYLCFYITVKYYKTDKLKMFLDKLDLLGFIGLCASAAIFVFAMITLCVHVCTISMIAFGIAFAVCVTFVVFYLISKGIIQLKSKKQQ
ncbi:MAG: hypothetical protein K5923_00570, partial [Clostridia bacterium]|nr:hypothetical protein [Clostridia bacterium]